MKQKGFSNLVIMLIIIVFIIVGIAGYWVFIKKLDPLNQQTSQIPTTTYPAKDKLIKLGGDSMRPEYKNGDVLEIDKNFTNLKRGDIVLLKAPNRSSIGEPHPGQLFIKRIIGLPGEKVEIKNSKVFINGKELNEAVYVTGGIDGSTSTSGTINTTLSNDKYFVLGDNRNFSYDSRMFGAVLKAEIVGAIIRKIEVKCTYENNQKKCEPEVDLVAG